MKAPVLGTVYLIHFDQPFRHARHYIGWTKRESPRRRLRVHRDGYGARLLQVLNYEGIGYRVARIWPGVSRDFERRLKRRKSAPCMCPLCRPTAKLPRYRYWRQ